MRFDIALTQLRRVLHDAGCYPYRLQREQVSLQDIAPPYTVLCMAATKVTCKMSCTRDGVKSRRSSRCRGQKNLDGIIQGRLKSSGMWPCAVGRILADVSKYHSALISRVKQFINAEVLFSEGDDAKVLGNVGNYCVVGKRMVWNEWKLWTWNTIWEGLTTAG
jgi:hypothetical protein